MTPSPWQLARAAALPPSYRSPFTPLFCSLLASALLFAAGPSQADTPNDNQPARETGKASYYGPQFTGRPMADGTPFDPDSNFAASRTLPLGTWVQVTNMENGKSEVVQIRDRGPYIDGRIIDLSPSTAGRLDMLEQGVVRVEVVPLDEHDSQFAQTEEAPTSGE